MNTQLIKQRFEKSLKTYNDNAIVQKMMAKKLISLINISHTDKILELGCGTGLLTTEAVKKFYFKKYLAIDMIDKCSKYISEISKDIDFLAINIEDFNTDEKYDLIISNASFQWIEDLERLIFKTEKFLNKKGTFIFSTFGEFNFKEMQSYIKSPLKYYSTKELTEILSKYQNVEITEYKQTLDFESPTDVLYHIKKTGVNALTNTRWTKSDLVRFEQTYPKTSKGKYPLTYHPIYVKIQL